MASLKSSIELKYYINTVAFYIFFICLLLVLSYFFIIKPLDENETFLQKMYSKYRHTYSKEIDSLSSLNQDTTFYTQAIIDVAFINNKEDFDRFYINDPYWLRPLIVFTFLLIVVGILGYFSYNLFVGTGLYFHCPHCYKVTYVMKIGKLKCPVCNVPNVQFIKLIRGDCDCETAMKYYKCPHCREEINFFAEYDKHKIKREIYDA